MLWVVEQQLREHALVDGEKARLGGVSFVHRFGSALNEHLHFHCAVIDGVFEPEPEGGEAVWFHEALLTETQLQQVQAGVCQLAVKQYSPANQAMSAISVFLPVAIAAPTGSSVPGADSHDSGEKEQCKDS